MDKNNNREVLEKEIDLIQSCINRMAQNSFMIKGWLITLIAVVLALLPETFNMKALCIIGLIITFCFWYLDSFFLRLEKLYRWKYEWVIKERVKTDEFSYDLNPYNNKMWLGNKDGTKKEVSSIYRIMFTKTLLPLYLPIIVAIILFFINTFVKWF